ncbi:class I SAM-dependent DNA methyltransferase [soil metagenome]
MAQSLTLNEIRSRALAFSKEWKGERSEAAEKQTFWNEFFNVFGIHRRRVASFEVNVDMLKGARGKIDLFWPGLLLVEHKSAGKDLATAFKQAADYFDGLDDVDLPKYVIVSDFARIKVYNLDDKTEAQFPLAKLHENTSVFGFLTGHTFKTYEEAPEVNVKAAQHMADLHDALKKNGYTDHPLAVLMVRLMFCMFADHTGLFPKQLFRDLIERKTDESGVDVGPMIQQVFSVLDTPEAKRQTNLDQDLASFRYVNGLLFKDRYDPPAFDKAARHRLLQCLAFDWSAVSPAIFGSMFQMVMEEEKGKRRKIGAHYTSEKNILKCLRPVLIDPLRTEFARATTEAALERLLARIAGMAVLDPACGCGNFLVIAYRELRQVEIDIWRRLRDLRKRGDERMLSVEFMKGLDVEAMYGIEVEDFPCEVARTALYIMDHMMSMKASEEFYEDFVRLPLKSAPHIVRGNALRTNWGKVAPLDKLAAIVGNPPFIGKAMRNDEQAEDMDAVFGDWDKHAELDYVAAWYVKAAEFIKGTNVPVAFVSTNSITQGEQVSILWPRLVQRGIRIAFAHRTFKWTNDAPGAAAVHCVIIGFGYATPGKCLLFDYETPKSEPQVREVKRINPYLVDYEDVFVYPRRKPICAVPEIKFGNMPNEAKPRPKELEGKYTQAEIAERTKDQLLLTTEERDALLEVEPGAAKWIRRIYGSEEFINGIDRWCLWLVDATASELKAMPHVMRRVQVVKTNRLGSKREQTRELAKTPWLFGEIRQPDGSYLLIPSVSSEGRPLIPMGFMPPEVIASNLALMVPNADTYHFGILQSTMHMAWVRQVCGRIKSDYRYSNEIVYNNFPWPAAPTDKQQAAVRAAAQALLDARAAQKGQTLAALYDAEVMPVPIRKAHAALDKAVDLCYRPQPFDTELSRVRFLFERYAELSAAGQLNLLGPTKKDRTRKAQAKNQPFSKPPDRVR